jgi:hypothetical protein
MKDWKALEQVKDAETPEEMRAELYRLQSYDPLVRAVMDSANYRGASAEDRYTVLAYNALKQLAEIKLHVLDDAMLRPTTRMIMPSNEAVEKVCSCGHFAVNQME